MSDKYTYSSKFKLLGNADQINTVSSLIRASSEDLKSTFGAVNPRFELTDIQVNDRDQMISIDAESFIKFDDIQVSAFMENWLENSINEMYPQWKGTLLNESDKFKDAFDDHDISDDR